MLLRFPNSKRAPTLQQHGLARCCVKCAAWRADLLRQVARRSLGLLTESRLTVKDSAEGDFSTRAVSAALICCQFQARGPPAPAAAPATSEQAAVHCRIFPAPSWKWKQPNTRAPSWVFSLFHLILSASCPGLTTTVFLFSFFFVLRRSVSVPASSGVCYPFLKGLNFCYVHFL